MVKHNRIFSAMNQLIAEIDKPLDVMFLSFSRLYLEQCFPTRFRFFLEIATVFTFVSYNYILNQNI